MSKEERKSREWKPSKEMDHKIKQKQKQNKNQKHQLAPPTMGEQKKASNSNVLQDCTKAGFSILAYDLSSMMIYNTMG